MTSLQSNLLSLYFLSAYTFRGPSSVITVHPVHDCSWSSFWVWKWHEEIIECAPLFTDLFICETVSDLSDWFHSPHEGIYQILARSYVRTLIRSEVMRIESSERWGWLSQCIFRCDISQKTCLNFRLATRWSVLSVVFASNKASLIVNDLLRITYGTLVVHPVPVLAALQNPK